MALPPQSQMQYAVTQIPLDDYMRQYEAVRAQPAARRRWCCGLCSL